MSTPPIPPPIPPASGRRRVASVQIGLAAPLPWGDRTVPSGIVKTPTAASVTVGLTGIEGDEQADLRVHGGPDKAVYAYASEDLHWWSDELGRPVEPGLFGENLTTIGVDVTSAAIGERWQVGTTQLEVCQPRFPCFKLGARMGDPAFVELFEEALRPGCYLRVLTVGTLQAGDEIAVMPPAHESLTVAEVARAELQQVPHLLERMVHIAALPERRRRRAAKLLQV